MPDFTLRNGDILHVTGNAQPYPTNGQTISLTFRDEQGIAHNVDFGDLGFYSISDSGYLVLFDFIPRQIGFIDDDTFINGDPPVEIKIYDFFSHAFTSDTAIATIGHYGLPNPEHAWIWFEDRAGARGGDWDTLRYVFDHNPEPVIDEYSSGQLVRTLNADYREHLIPLTPRVFSEYNDAVDLRNWQQSAAARDHADVSKALKGNDTVRLPDTQADFTGLNLTTFDGGAGDDTVTGGLLADTISGGIGNDSVLGGGGNDILTADPQGNDTLLGGGGDDSINGGLGDDSVSGEDGADTLLGFDGNDTLWGGAGDDSITGGIGNDSIQGGDGADTLVASNGMDTLDGGAGIDVFSFEGLALTPANSQTILGGRGPDQDTEIDLLRLPGRAADYEIAVSFQGQLWSDAKTVITHKASGTTFTTREVEHVTFAQPLSFDQNVQLFRGNLTIEMLRLADEVYGPQPTLFGRTWELDPLAYEPIHEKRYSEDVSITAVARGWHAVDAIELGMKPLDTQGSSVYYSFVEGHYQAFEDYVGPEANALVLTGSVNGQKTLAIALRGTDTFSDFKDYASFSTHFAKFQPLVAGLQTYIQDNSIEHVYISGHSLGAGVANYFANALNGASDLRIYTDGSPGSEVGVPGGVGVLNFVNSNDVVPQIGDASNSLPLRIALTAALAPDLPELALLLASIAPKTRSGTTVVIDSDVGSVVSLDEHASWLYVRELEKLLDFAKDAGHPFAASGFAQSLVANQIYSGAPIRIAVGQPSTSPVDDPRTYGDDRYDTSFKSSIFAYAADDFVLGNRGKADQIVINGGNIFITTVSSDLLSTTGHRLIDGGGGGRDALVLPYTRDNFDVQPTSGGDYDVNFHGTAFRSAGYVATLHRIGLISYLDRLVALDGQPLHVQTPAAAGNAASSGASSLRALAAADVSPPLITFQLADGFDYADAGVGDYNVIGTSAADIIYLGAGNKTVAGAGGDDTILVRDNETSDFVFIDGGAGDDIIVGGRGDETYRVDSAGDLVIVHLIEGHHAVEATVDYRLVDNVQDLSLVGAARRGSGNAADNFIQGNESANELSGMEGADTLVGGGGDDTLTGGAGNDSLVGGGGTDAAVYSGLSTDYTVQNQPDGTRTVTDLRAGSPDGADTLSGVEVLQFSDSFVEPPTGGTPGDDVFQGGEGADTYAGFAGRDTIRGGGGDDQLFGGQDADNLDGGAGNDTVLGGAGDDFLHGGAGDDLINGEAGAFDVATYADATSGVAVSLAVSGPQTVGGGAGVDNLAGVESLIGSSFADTLTGDANANILTGLAGDDVLNGGGGVDSVDYYSATGGVTVNLSLTGPQNVGGGQGADTLLNVENILSSFFADTLTGSAGDNYFNTRGGGDRVAGGDGYDIVDFRDLTGGVNANLATGTATSVNGADTLSSIESLQGTNFADTLTGDSASNYIAGGAGGDQLNGGDGADGLAGQAGDDSLSGGLGNDTANFSGARADYQVQLMAGGVAVVTDLRAGSPDGSDTLGGVEVLQFSDQLVPLAFNENVTGTSGPDTFQGGGGNDTFTGLGARDIIRGGAGDDLLIAGDGDDDVNGQDGADTLIGGGGGDYLHGGAGNDRIDGGDGFDTAAYYGAPGGVSVDLRIIGPQDVGGGAGIDTVVFIDALAGSPFADTLTGDAGNNNIAGQKGDDLLDGGGGIDNVDYYEATSGVTVDLRLSTAQNVGGGHGVDTLLNFENVLGSFFADNLTGTAGDNYFNTRGGGDRIAGGDGFDTVDFRDLTGGVSASLATGTANSVNGADTLSGIEGLAGSAFSDTLNGDAANNYLAGGAAGDVLDGSGGSDFLNGQGGNDSLTGGAGSDTAQYSGARANYDVQILAGNLVTVTDLRAGAPDGADTLSGVESLQFSDQTLVLALNENAVGTEGPDTYQGGAGNDTYSGLGSRDIIRGGPGNDLLIAGDGDDDVNGQDGADTIQGGNGNDFMQGGPGDDRLDGGLGFGDAANYADATSAVSIDLRITSAQAVGGNLGIDTLVQIESLRGSAFGDLLIGNELGNYLVGNAGDDTISGQAGDDNLEGGAGDDLLEGGAGNDNAVYESATSGVAVNLALPGAQDVGGGRGFDTLVSIEGIVGSNFNDTLTGDAGTNFFEGHAGDDVIDGAGGFDQAYYIRATGGVTIDLAVQSPQAIGAGQGTDTLISVESLRGSQFADTLSGDGGVNTLAGDGGNDLLDGRGGIDTAEYFSATSSVTVNLSISGAQLVSAEQGSDALLNFENVGGSAVFSDTLTGDGGPNTLLGRGGDDILSGLGGNDNLVGGLGADSLTGGDGSDVLQGEAGSDSIDGGAGIDLVSFRSASESVKVDLSAQGVQQHISTSEGDDTIVNVEGAQGSDFNDTLSGDTNANSLFGFGGDDALSGGGGGDALAGMAGNDTLDGGAGFDFAFYSVSPAGGVHVDLTLSGPQDVGGGQGLDSLISVEGLFGTSFNDTFTGDGGANVLSGGNGDDVLRGGGGNDTLDGGVGSDTAQFSGASTAYAIDLKDDGSVTVQDLRQNTPDATDTLLNIENLAFADSTVTSASLVTPRILIGGSGGAVLSGGIGADVITGGSGSDTVSAGAGADKIEASGGNDVINSGSGDDAVNGGSGGDTVSGGSGADTVDGESGNDLLQGDAGADSLAGGSGGDTLAGGADNDTLTGDSGGDLFLFGPDSGNDRVLDFALRSDHIRLEGGAQVQSWSVVGTDTQILLSDGDGVITLAGVRLSASTFDLVFG